MVCVSKEDRVACGVVAEKETDGSTSPTNHPTRTVNNPNTSTNKKPLNVMSAIFGECLCEPFNPSSGEGLSQSAQFVELHGIEFIGLGAVEDELSPKERVSDTLEQLTSQTERLISIGYLVDQEDIVATSSSGSSSSTSPPTDTMASLKVAETIPLDIWSQEYPNDRHMSRAVKRTISHIKSKDYKAALGDFQKEYNTQNKHPRRNNNSYLLGITAHNMGVVCALAGNDIMSLSHFEEAVKLKREAFGPEHLEVAISLDELGIQMFAREQFEDALAAFNDSRKIKSKSIGLSHPGISMVLNNIACCNFQMGNSIAAMLNLKEARDLQQKIQSTSGNGNPDGKGRGAKADLDLLHMATVVANLGYLQLNLKQYDDASACFQEALLIQQSVLGDDHNHRAIRDTRNNLDFTNAFHS